uniref:Uncharacterized protein n=1 Tax=Opuntia streptacantha TaxID=393608 RepID=A0A7C8Z253_OPUST
MMIWVVRVVPECGELEPFCLWWVCDGGLLFDRTRRRSRGGAGHDDFLQTSCRPSSHFMMLLLLCLLFLLLLLLLESLTFEHQSGNMKGVIIKNVVHGCMMQRRWRHDL